jgi:uroporphyrinogen decarboxylase
MNRRELLLSLINEQNFFGYVPAAFFMHFDEAHKLGQAAIEKHLEFFRYTGMDLVKIQYEQVQPPGRHIRKPKDWARVPLYGDEFFEPTLRVVEGLVKAAGSEALVIMTLYSPFMWLCQYDRQADINAHFMENPEAVAGGLQIMTENVIKLAHGCMRAGVDGFYASTQGREAFRFTDPGIFLKYIKPTDLAVWEAIQDCRFNILHVCDYEGGYANLDDFLDYPGQVVNCSLVQETVPKVLPSELIPPNNPSGRSDVMTPRDASLFFGRPFMGGMDRKGVIATGDKTAIHQAVESVLQQAPERFILAADCTVPAETPWENLKTAIEVAHGYNRRCTLDD